VIGKGAPRVVDRDRASRFAVISIALVHRDTAEVALEFLRRVEHGRWPFCHARVQAPSGGDQQREAGAHLLVADPDIAFLIERRGGRLWPGWRGLTQHRLGGRQFGCCSAGRGKRHKGSSTQHARSSWMFYPLIELQDQRLYDGSDTTGQESCAPRQRVFDTEGSFRRSRRFCTLSPASQRECPDMEKALQRFTAGPLTFSVRHELWDG